MKLALIGQAFSEEMFEHCGRTDNDADNDDGRRSMGIL